MTDTLKRDKVAERIGTILASDPICNGRVCTDTVERLTEFVMEAERRGRPVGNMAVREALEWYADRKNFEIAGDPAEDFSEAESDAGARARKALATLHTDQGNMSGGDWRPIESAPRDGRDILLHYPLDGLNHANHARVIIGFWRHSGSYPKVSGWVFQGRAVRAYSDCYQPTHWQPLPAPPVAAGDGEDRA